MTPFTMSLEVIVGGAVSIAANAAIIGAWGARLGERQKNMAEDIHIVKGALGLNGDGPEGAHFQRVSACTVLHEQVMKELSALTRATSEHMMQPGHSVGLTKFFDYQETTNAHLGRIDEKLKEHSGNLKEIAVRAGIVPKNGG